MSPEDERKAKILNAKRDALDAPERLGWFMKCARRATLRPEGHDYLVRLLEAEIHTAVEQQRPKEELELLRSALRYANFAKGLPEEQKR